MFKKGFLIINLVISILLWIIFFYHAIGTTLGMVGLIPYASNFKSSGMLILILLIIHIILIFIKVKKSNRNIKSKSLQFPLLSGVIIFLTIILHSILYHIFGNSNVSFIIGIIYIIFNLILTGCIMMHITYTLPKFLLVLKKLNKIKFKKLTYLLKIFSFVVTGIVCVFNIFYYFLI